MPKKRGPSLKEYVGLFDVAISIRAKTEKQAYQRAESLRDAIKVRRRPRWIGALEITHVSAEAAVPPVIRSEPEEWAATWLATMKA